MQEMLHPNAGLEPSLTKQPTPLSAIDIEHEDFEWLRAYLQREAMQPTQSGSESDVPIVGRKHKSHHSSSSSDASTCDSPTHRSSIDSYDDESDSAAPSKRRNPDQQEDLVLRPSASWARSGRASRAAAGPDRRRGEASRISDARDAARPQRSRRPLASPRPPGAQPMASAAEDTVRWATARRATPRWTRCSPRRASAATARCQAA